MFIRTTLGALLLGISWIACAAPPMKAVEDAIEASTDEVAPPADASGSIIARRCAACPQVLLRLDATSKYFVGRTEVSYETLAKFWRESGTRTLGIFFDRKTLTVARVIVEGELPR